MQTPRPSSQRILDAMVEAEGWTLPAIAEATGGHELRVLGELRCLEVDHKVCRARAGVWRLTAATRRELAR